MLYETRFRTEHKRWLELRVSTGTELGFLKEEKEKLILFLKTLSQSEAASLTSIIKRPIDFTGEDYSPILLQLIHIKKFVENNPTSILSEAVGVSLSPPEFNKYLFLKLVEDIFQKSKFPEDLYLYTTYIRRGTPTTWLKIQDITLEEFKKTIETRAEGLCRSITFKFKYKRRNIRMNAVVNNYLIYLIDKPYKVEVIPTKKVNKEVQRSSTSFLVADLNKLRVGYVSRNRKEVLYAHTYIKTKMFASKVISTRSQANIKNEVLVEKLLNPQKFNSPLIITSIKLKRSNFVGNPSLTLLGPEGESIQEAITDGIEEAWRGINLSDVGQISYLLRGKKNSIYTYPDFQGWNTTYINYVSRGAPTGREAEFLSVLKELIGDDIKETRFVTNPITPGFIIEKLLREKIVYIDPPLPKEVDSLIYAFKKRGIFRIYTNQAKRRCVDWSCPTYSWTDTTCPVCGREMFICGEALKIDLIEKKFLNILNNILDKTGYDVNVQSIQRNKALKNLIRVVNNKALATYILLVSSPKDIRFCELLSRENNGIVALCNVPMYTKKELLKSIGCYVIDLPDVLSYLYFDTDSSIKQLNSILLKAIYNQEQRTLERIYKLLNSSEDILKSKPKDYNASRFEIDIQNIFQALVPNVMRLGQSYSGISVPDGYCGFRVNDNRRYLFGWDAKYSQGGTYALDRNDARTQIKYITWLVNTSEPKMLGYLRVYAIVSNYKTTRGFRKTLKLLGNDSRKPRYCRIILLQDVLIARLSKWLLKEWKRVIDDGPNISRSFFDWLLKGRRPGSKKWTAYDMNDWPRLEKILKGLV